MPDSWSVDQNGNITLHPLLGYGMMVAGNDAIGLRLNFVGGPEISSPSPVQLVLTPEQAAQLAEDLIATTNALLGRSRVRPN
jgi:hypothetical protein